MDYISLHPTRRSLNGVVLGKPAIAMNGRVRSEMGMCWLSLNTPYGPRLPFAKEPNAFGVMCMTNPIADAPPLPETSGEEKEKERAQLQNLTDEEREAAKALKKQLDTGRGLAYIFTKTAGAANNNTANALALDGSTNTVHFGGTPGHPDTLFEVHCVGLVGETEFYNLFSILHRKYISFGPRGFVVDTKEDSKGAVAITLAPR